MISFYALVFCFLLGSANAACPHEMKDLAKWSAAASWPGGSVPVDGDNVTISTKILLDVATARLASLVVSDGGFLVFDPKAELAMVTSNYVLVDDGGSLYIGSEDCKFEGTAEILLTGMRGQYDISGFGEKFVGVRDGTLEIHGMERLSWTQLTKHVGPTEEGQDFQIELVDDASSWKKGDRLVIASTDYDYRMAEEVAVHQCSGNVCEVCGILKHKHYGEMYKGVDMRAEVGLLTRNVKIHGEMEEFCYTSAEVCKDKDFDVFGGHLKSDGPFKTFKIEGAEFFDMGQMGLLAR